MMVTSPDPLVPIQRNMSGCEMSATPPPPLPQQLQYIHDHHNSYNAATTQSYPRMLTDSVGSFVCRHRRRRQRHEQHEVFQGKALLLVLLVWLMIFKNNCHGESYQEQDLTLPIPEEVSPDQTTTTSKATSKVKKNKKKKKKRRSREMQRWTVAATTPLGLRRDHDEASFVHWVCFTKLQNNNTDNDDEAGRQREEKKNDSNSSKQHSSRRNSSTSSTGGEKMSCCQEIFRLMTNEPQLCYQYPYSECTDASSSRASFLRMCSQIIAPVPTTVRHDSPHHEYHNTTIHSTTRLHDSTISTPHSHSNGSNHSHHHHHDEDRITPPRWSLVLANPGTTSTRTSLTVEFWRQCISFSISAGHWYYTVISPFRLATETNHHHDDDDSHKEHSDHNILPTNITNRIIPRKQNQPKRLESLLSFPLPQVEVSDNPDHQTTSSHHHNDSQVVSFQAWLTMIVTIPESVRVITQTEKGMACTTMISQLRKRRQYPQQEYNNDTKTTNCHIQIISSIDNGFNETLSANPIHTKNKKQYTSTVPQQSVVAILMELNGSTIVSNLESNYSGDNLRPYKNDSDHNVNDTNNHYHRVDDIVVEVNMILPLQIMDDDEEDAKVLSPPVLEASRVELGGNLQHHHRHHPYWTLEAKYHSTRIKNNSKNMNRHKSKRLGDPLVLFLEDDDDNDDDNEDDSFGSEL